VSVWAQLRVPQMPKSLSIEVNSFEFNATLHGSRDLICYMA